MISPLTAFTVTSISPACGSTLTDRIYTFVVTFSDPVLAASVHNTSFTVNGINASSVGTISGNNVTFNFVNTPLTSGTQIMAVPANSVQRASDSLGVTAFSCTLTMSPIYAPIFLQVPCLMADKTTRKIVNSASRVKRFIPQPFRGGAGVTETSYVGGD